MLWWSRFVRRLLIAGQWYLLYYFKSWISLSGSLYCLVFPNSSIFPINCLTEWCILRSAILSDIYVGIILYLIINNSGQDVSFLVLFSGSNRGKNSMRNWLTWTTRISNWNIWQLRSENESKRWLRKSRERYGHFGHCGHFLWWFANFLLVLFPSQHSFYPNLLQYHSPITKNPVIFTCLLFRELEIFAGIMGTQSTEQ